MIYTNNLSGSTTVNATATSILLTMPYRGTLTRLVIKQTSGAAEGFTFNLYDCDPTAPADSMNADTHKVMGGSGVVAPEDTYELYDAEVPYQNTEVASTDLAQRPKSRLYLRITSGGTGTTTKNYNIGYTVIPAL